MESQTLCSCNLPAYNNDSKSPEAKRSLLAVSVFHVRAQVGQQHVRLALT